MIRLDELEPGDVLSDWYDTGAFGAKLIFFEVIRTGAKMVRVRDERGRESWRRPERFIRRCRPEEVEWLTFPKEAS